MSQNEELMLSALVKVREEILAHWTVDDLIDFHCGMDVALERVEAAIRTVQPS